MRNLFLCLVMALMASVWVMADDSADTKGKSDTRTITGCLSQGDNAKEFNLKADDGSTWEVRSSRVALAKHVGHTVEVTGVVKNAMAHNMKEDTKDMAHDTGMKKENSEHGHLTVTHLKMVSESCSQ
jgi:hypothetical protein